MQKIRILILNNLYTMIKNSKALRKLFPLTIVVIGILLSTKQAISQESPFQVRIGYEQLYVRPGLTNNIAEKKWVWTDEVTNDDYFTMRTGVTQAYTIGVQWDAFPWVSIGIDYKNFYRRYYIWEGTYLSEAEGKYPANQYSMIPMIGLFGSGKSLGRTLTTSSWQLGIEFHQPITFENKWYLHYYVSLNVDLYEKKLQFFDTPVNYQSTGVTSVENVDNQEITVSHQIDGLFTLKGNNPLQAAYRPSMNLALAISRQLKRDNKMRLEVGLRNILWTKNVLLAENHWELDLTHERFYFDENTGEKQVIYSTSITHNFPLYLGGIYANISFVFRPFKKIERKKSKKKTT